ncbi:MAG: nucleotidyltransferase family protein [Candidatus Asgardarchaeia archaeon]
MVVGVILAGGTGSRLRPLSYYFQKVMIPIGRMQKPLLEYSVRIMSHYGIKRIFVLVNYKAEQIINYFGSGERFGVEISYVYDPVNTGYKGNGIALLNAIEKEEISDTFLVWYGDIIADIDLRDFLRYHRERDAVATVALAKKFQVSVGVGKVKDDGRLEKFIEKPYIEWPVNIGILLMEPQIVEIVKEIKEEKNSIDISKDIIPKLIERGGKVYGYVSDLWWYDVGSIEKYEKLDNDELDKHFAFLFNDEAQINIKE